MKNQAMTFEEFLISNLMKGKEVKPIKKEMSTFESLMEEILGTPKREEEHNVRNEKEDLIKFILEDLGLRPKEKSTKKELHKKCTRCGKCGRVFEEQAPKQESAKVSKEDNSEIERLNKEIAKLKSMLLQQDKEQAKKTDTKRTVFEVFPQQLTLSFLQEFIKTDYEAVQDKAKSINKSYSKAKLQPTQIEFYALVQSKFIQLLDNFIDTRDYKETGLITQQNTIVIPSTLGNENDFDDAFFAELAISYFPVLFAEVVKFIEVNKELLNDEIEETVEVAFEAYVSLLLNILESYIELNNYPTELELSIDLKNSGIADIIPVYINSFLYFNVKAPMQLQSTIMNYLF